MNKSNREYLESYNLFADKKFSRQAWKAVGNAILRMPVSKPAPDCSPLEMYTYNQLTHDIKLLCDAECKEEREPTQLEMIMACQIMKARNDTAAAIFVRDTLGAKPVDESKVQAEVSNPYEMLTDEELEMLARMREQKESVTEGATAEDTTLQTGGEDA